MTLDCSSREVETLQYSQYCNIMSSRLDTLKHIITYIEKARHNRHYGFSSRNETTNFFFCT